MNSTPTILVFNIPHARVLPPDTLSTCIRSLCSVQESYPVHYSQPTPISPCPDHPNGPPTACHMGQLMARIARLLLSLLHVAKQQIDQARASESALQSAFQVSHLVIPRFEKDIRSFLQVNSNRRSSYRETNVLTPISPTVNS